MVFADKPQIESINNTLELQNNETKDKNQIQPQIENKDSVQLNKKNQKDNDAPEKLRKREHFIDKDGDGINDHRCNGFGPKHNKAKGRRGGRKN